LTLDDLDIDGDIGDIELIGAGSFDIDITDADTVGDIDAATGVTDDTVVNIDASGVEAAVTVTFGEGSNTYTASQNDDEVTLGDAVGTDALVMNATAAGSITINNFEAGSGGDVIDISIGGINAWAADGSNAVTLTDIDLNHEAVTGVVILEEVTGDFDFDDVSGDENILVLDSDIASESALKTALAASGTHEITTVDFNDDEAFLVLWDDGANSYLSAVANISGASIDNTTFATSAIAVETFITFDGVTDATSLDAANLGTTLIA